MSSPQPTPPITLKRLWVRGNVLTMVLIVFILLSLVLHVLTITSLLRVRSILSQQLDITTNNLAQVRQQKISYTFPIDETFTVDTSVAFNETITVPISLTVPISDTLRYPLNTPAGNFVIPIPINMTVPISETITIPINRDIPIKADVPVRADVPVELDLQNGAVADLMQQLQDALQALREGL